MTPEQRTNLDKLATYLEALPADYNHFDMNYFLDIPDDETINDEEALTLDYVKTGVAVGTLSCGTAACALGHGPAAGILFNEYEILFDLDWVSYGKRFADVNSALDWFLFSCSWKDTDDTHQGAAARIRYALDEKNQDVNLYEVDVDEYAFYLKVPA